MSCQVSISCATVALPEGQRNHKGGEGQVYLGWWLFSRITWVQSNEKEAYFDFSYGMALMTHIGQIEQYWISTAEGTLRQETSYTSCPSPKNRNQHLHQLRVRRLQSTQGHHRRRRRSSRAMQGMRKPDQWGWRLDTCSSPSGPCYQPVVALVACSGSAVTA